MVLETLNPNERAVFVLSEVFAFRHNEIAAMVGKSDAAVRQIAHRARGHVHSRRPPFRPDRQSSDSIVEQFLLAAGNGDVQQLMSLMAPGVVQITDGGGKVTAASNPAVVITDHERTDSVLVCDIHDGLIRGLYAVRNPDKLGHSRTLRPLTRTARPGNKPSTGERS
ncbi:sigma factor-like helix-turn-helix DNA-binding protein [Rhodococcus sp. NPDC058521]|uniref:sigma factor-like helix-turn-helix DNA-binding protein n=1 Tax=Rhodococcus sp. NPDC058521 TaxID=3346536 RepID=UPI00365E6BCE